MIAYACVMISLLLAVQEGCGCGAIATRRRAMPPNNNKKHISSAARKIDNYLISWYVSAHVYLYIISTMHTQAKRCAFLGASKKRSLAMTRARRDTHHTSKRSRRLTALSRMRARLLHNGVRAVLARNIFHMPHSFRHRTHLFTHCVCTRNCFSPEDFAFKLANAPCVSCG